MIRVLFVCLANGERMAIPEYVFATPAVALGFVVTTWLARRPPVPA